MNRSILAVLLLAMTAIVQAADAPAFTSTTLRLFEQADDGVEPVARRIYATHFDATRMRWLGVELDATYAAPPESVLVPLDCRLIRPDGSQSTTGRDMSFQFFSGESESSSANLLWGVDDEADWEVGQYRVECDAAGKRVGEASFEVVQGPSDVAGADIRVAEMRFFAIVEDLPKREQRAYTRHFPGAETRRIGVELEFTHARLGRPIKLPIACYFYWPDGQTSPPLTLDYEPEPQWEGGYSAGGMGWDEPGQWMRGVYTTVCMIHGRPVAIERLEIQ